MRSTATVGWSASSSAGEFTKRRNALIQRTHIDQDRVVAELAALGFSNIADFLDPETGEPTPLHRLSRFTTAAVKKLKVHETLDATGTVTKRTTEIELMTKEGALEKLGRHLGVFDGRVSEPTPPRDEKHRDPSVSPARGLATLVMAAMREAKERRIAEDGNGDLPTGVRLSCGRRIVRPRSLRVRLVAAGTLAIIVALIGIAVGLALLFERHVERRVLEELSAEIDRIASGITLNAEGVHTVANPTTDPRLLQPFSGYYWQVQIGDLTTRSRSLWDAELALQTTAEPGVLHSYRIVGPASEDVLLAERLVTLPERMGGAEARIAVAIDRITITEATAAFRTDLLPYLVVVGLLIVAAGFIQVTVGLRPLGAIRTRLAAIKAGRVARLGDGFPSEVQPLVDEVDSLLEESERAVERARTRAADLAHALKTPLQVLAGDADRLVSKGEVEIAYDINVLETGAEVGATCCTECFVETHSAA